MSPGNDLFFLKVNISPRQTILTSNTNYLRSPTHFMELALQGIIFGLTLSILVGPILFALLQTAIERGFRAGAMVGAGVWFSDLMFIVISYSSMAYIIAITKWDGFEYTLGTVGGLVLLGFGIGTFFSKPPAIPDENEYSDDIIDEQLPEVLEWDEDEDTNLKDAPDYFKLWLKGFLINTLNPFTVFFWTGVTSTVVIGRDFNDNDALIFFGGIFLTVVITDLLKIWAAKAVRHLLKPSAVLILRRISGAALAVFGVALMVRVFMF